VGAVSNLPLDPLTLTLPPVRRGRGKLKAFRSSLGEFDRMSADRIHLTVAEAREHSERALRGIGY
jgi:hypothetical protein